MATPPTQGEDHRAATIMLRNNVAILGGFAGGETGKSQRNPAVNVTTLSGNLGTHGESHHVVTALATTNNAIDSSAVLDGFTISGGNADQSEIIEYSRIGGGMVLNGPTSTMQDEICAPTVVRCRFVNNRAMLGGAIGMKISQSSAPVFGSCIITANNASSDGGGVFVRGDAGTMGGKPKFVNCLFTHNEAEGETGADQVGSGNRDASFQLHSR